MPEAPAGPAPVSTPAPAPAPAAEAPSSDYLASYENDFDAMDKAGTPDPKPADKPAAVPAKPPEQPKPTELEEDLGNVEPPKKPDDKLVAKPPEKPADIKPVKAADLRTAYEGLKKRVKEEYEPQLQSLKSKVQEFESRKPDDPAPVMAKLTELQKRNEELERHMQYVDYTRSLDFTVNYAQPYQEAWHEAAAEFRELTVRERDGEDEAGEPKFKTRPADENDILKLANMRTSDMDAAAVEMFGHSSARAVNHIQNLKRLSAKQAKALEQARTKAAEWSSQRELESKSKNMALASTWSSVNKALEERYPKAFHVEQADADDVAAHTKGFALADLMFQGQLSPEQADALPESFRDTVKAGKPLTDAQRVQLHAIVRLKAANHDRKVAALKKATARIAELEKSLSEYQQSEPKAGKAGESTPTGKDWQEQVNDELAALDK